MKKLLPLLFLLSSTLPAAHAQTSGLNEFGFSMYRHLAKEGENVFFSPYSIYTALAMAYEGARGETRSQLARAVHFPEDDAAFEAAVKGINENLEPFKSKVDFNLAVANSEWIKEGYQVLPEYNTALANLFHSEAFMFSTPKDAVGRINKWVEENTKGMIKDLLSERSVTGGTRVILASAIYMLGYWRHEFDKQDTHEAPFFHSGSESFQTEFMSTLSKYDYAETDLYQLVLMPYRSADVSLCIILPKERTGLSKVEAELDAENLAGTIEGQRMRRVSLTIPKFEAEMSASLAEILKKAGAGDAFDLNKADFSGISGDIAPLPLERRLYIGDVLHKARVRVDERGTEAAAATAVMMMAGSAGPIREEEPVTFTADHPFIYLIRENKSGAILFMGRYAKPA